VASDPASVSYSAECQSCFALGPRETSPTAARASWDRRSHDVEWCYRMGARIARRFCDAIGQRDESKIEALAVEISSELLEKAAVNEAADK
jgi:hypothetical protein